MAFDYKKEYKEFYLPGKKPQLVEVPEDLRPVPPGSVR